MTAGGERCCLSRYADGVSGWQATGTEGKGCGMYSGGEVAWQLSVVNGDRGK